MIRFGSYHVFPGDRRPQENCGADVEIHRERHVAPSLILAGPEGVGKRMAAIGIAQIFNCATADGCGTCAACRRIARGIHPDVQLIEPGDSGSIKVEQVRDAIERTVYRPFEGRKRVTIIDSAEALVPAAQNALLKTLEEPPGIFGIHSRDSPADALLDTIRSRCSMIRFARLSTADVSSILEKNHKYARREAVVGRLSCGWQCDPRPRRACRGSLGFA